MMTDFLSRKKSKEVYDAIIDRMMELNMNIPESWKEDWAIVLYDEGATKIVPVENVDPQFDEVIAYKYSVSKIYNMLPKLIYKRHCEPLVLVHECYNDRIKYCNSKDQSIAVRDWHEGDFGTNIADAFIWWLKSSYFMHMFSKMKI